MLLEIMSVPRGSVKQCSSVEDKRARKCRLICKEMLAMRNGGQQKCGVWNSRVSQSAAKDAMNVDDSGMAHNDWSAWFQHNSRWFPSGKRIGFMDTHRRHCAKVGKVSIEKEIKSMDKGGFQDRRWRAEQCMQWMSVQ